MCITGDLPLFSEVGFQVMAKRIMYFREPRLHDRICFDDKRKLRWRGLTRGYLPVRISSQGVCLYIYHQSPKRSKDAKILFSQENYLCLSCKQSFVCSKLCCHGEKIAMRTISN